MSDTPRRILVTSALPYANGPIHLGHLVEYGPTSDLFTAPKLIETNDYVTGRFG